MLVLLTVFTVVFIAELPDKTAIACLVLSTRYAGRPVFAGVAAAFAVHVALAVSFGALLARVPDAPLQAATAVLFLAGMVLLLRSSPEEAAAEGAANAELATAASGGPSVAGASFVVVLVAEFGDLTQIMTATLAAKYDSPWAVAAGAVLALWCVAGLALGFGRRLLTLVPLRRVQQVAATVLGALAVHSAVTAVSSFAAA